MSIRFALCVFLVGVLVSCARNAGVRVETAAHEGWTAVSPRDEIRPRFLVEEGGGPDGEPALVIAADGRDGQDGYWLKSFPVEGGCQYRFQAFRHADGGAVPPQAVLARLIWLDNNGELAQRPDDRARPEYPTDRGTEDTGWTEVSDTFLAPDNATRVSVELRFRWFPNATVKWSKISIAPVEPPKHRTVRVASVHFHPRDGRTIRDNCEMFAPLVQEAARRGADLVVLPEYAMSEGLPGPPEKRAEPVPGPATDFFAALAARRDLYVVVTLLERAGHLVYNIAALVGPEGYIGKYRKVCPAREEYASGIAAGDEYPVFDTRFGKVGMMICWDLQFPQVASRLAAKGAEIIACPIAGGNPKLAQARAIENQVYLVTSTYTRRPDWMKTGIWDMQGNLIAHTEEWGSMVVADLDLDHHVQWEHMGDVRRRLKRERPQF